jgi:hypothetical protein
VFSIESKFGVIVKEARSLEEAKSVLDQKEEPIDLFVCDFQGGSLEKLEGFFDVVNKDNNNLPLIYCVGSSETAKQPPVTWNVVGVVDRSSLIVNLLKIIEKIETDGKLKLEDEVSDYCKIRTKLLLSVVPLKGDIFIKLSEKKYIKMFHQGDDFNIEDMHRITVKKGIEYLFIKKRDCTEFIEKYNVELMGRVVQRKHMSISEVAEISDSIYDTIQELGLRLGFRKDVQAMARTHMRMTVKSMGKSPTLAGIIDKLESFQGGYIAAHSTLTGYMACAIAAHLEWASETTFMKLSLAAFLHDIVMENHDLAKCKTLEQSTTGSFTAAEKNIFKTHPLKAGDLAKRFQEVPPDVDIIILQHHELPEGGGFPRGIQSRYLAPLSCVFILAHELAVQAIEKGKDFKLTEGVALLKQHYMTSQFKRIVAAVEKLV